MDTSLPKFYKKVPLYRLCAQNQRGTGFGYTPAYDLLGIQEGVNGLYSTIITNQSTFGVQNIMIPSGSNVSLAELSDGLNLLTYDPKLGKPESLNLTATPAEIFNFLEKMEKTMETIAGVNSVARGNPEASLKSGSALALVQSMALQFISGLQQSYVTLLEDMGTRLINIMKANAKEPRMIEISGKNNKSYMKQFTVGDITDIDRVVVDFGNPVSRTTAGKVDMANTLLQNGMVENPAQYFQVISTGKLEPLIEGKQSEIMLIRSENEAMTEGKPVSAVLTDNHPIHVLEHKAVLSSVESRRDPNIVTAVLNHVQEHINLWKTADPSLLQMLQEPLPPPPVIPNVVDMGGNTEQMDATNPTEKTAQAVNLPKMPKNPLTGENANLPPTGV